MIHFTINVAAPRLAATCAFLFAASVAISSQNVELTDADQIATLMGKLCAHLANAGDLLDPQLAGRERKKGLDYFADPSYQLSLIPEGRVKVERDGRALVPVRVHFKNAGSTLDASAQLEFVEREGVWYFANFDFLGWPPFLVAVLVIGLLAGISFACGVLLLRSRLKKQGRLRGANLVKIFIPIFWPKLFSERR